MISIFPRSQAMSGCLRRFIVHRRSLRRSQRRLRPRSLRRLLRPGRRSSTSRSISQRCRPRPRLLLQRRRRLQEGLARSIFRRRSVRVSPIFRQRSLVAADLVISRWRSPEALPICRALLPVEVSRSPKRWEEAASARSISRACRTTCRSTPLVAVETFPRPSVQARIFQRRWARARIFRRRWARARICRPRWVQARIFRRRWVQARICRRR